MKKVILMSILISSFGLAGLARAEAFSVNDDDERLFDDIRLDCVSKIVMSIVKRTQRDKESKLNLTGAHVTYATANPNKGRQSAKIETDEGDKLVVSYFGRVANFSWSSDNATCSVRDASEIYTHQALWRIETEFGEELYAKHGTRTMTLREEAFWIRVRSGGIEKALP